MLKKDNTNGGQQKTFGCSLHRTKEATWSLVFTQQFFLSILQQRASWMMPRSTDYAHYRSTWLCVIAFECCPDSKIKASSQLLSKIFLVSPYCSHLKYDDTPANWFKIQLRMRFSNWVKEFQNWLSCPCECAKLVCSVHVERSTDSNCYYIIVNYTVLD